MKNFVVIILVFLGCKLHSQLTVNLPMVSAYALTPESMMVVSILSTESSITAQVELSLLDVQTNETIVRVTSGLFNIHQGVNQLSPVSTSWNTSFNGITGTFVQTHHQLPPGEYRFCILLKSSNLESNIEECESLESDLDMMLNLLYPTDGQIIENPYPLLSWMHNGPFGSGNLRFRLTVVEVYKDQTAEQAIQENPIVFMKSDVTTHNVPYPASAAELIPNHRYAWRVEALDGSRIVQTTDIWEFYLASFTPEPIMKYVELKKNQSAGIYPVKDERVYFKFKDGYKMNGVLPHAVITDQDGKPLKPETAIDDSDVITIGAFQEYILDTGPFNLKPGSYVLTVYNSKNDQFLLTLYVE